MRGRTLIITDTHFSIRGGNEAVERYQLKFFNDQLFPYIEENKDNIDLIVHMGDLFDPRRMIQIRSLSRWYTNFVERLDSYNIPIDVIIGNHDCPSKETNKNNLPEIILQNTNHFKVYSEPCEVGEFLYLPWINKENIEKSVQLIKDTKLKYCLGHLALAGFLMMAGHECEYSELKASDFLKFEFVLSGHFHWKSSQKNIHYLGDPYQLNWADVGNDKGFHIFDTKAKKAKLEFVKNELEQYIALEYDDTDESSEEAIKSIDFTEYNDMFVKIIVKKKTKPQLYSQFITALHNAGPVEVKIIDQELIRPAQEGQSIEVKDIPAIIKYNIEKQDIDENIQSKLIDYMTGLYTKTLY